MPAGTMQSLYWKIFLWFWGATILMLITGAWVTHQVALLSGASLETRGVIAARTAHHMHEMADAIAHGDRARLGRLAAEPRRGRAQVWIMDSAGEDHLGREAPPIARAIARSGADTPAPKGPVLVEPAHGPGGTTFLLIAELPPRRAQAEPGATAAAPDRARHERLELPRWARFLPGIGPHGERPLMWLRLLVAVLVSGVVCYLLARYFTKPMRGLRDATRRLSAGELSARVGPSLGHRRDEIGELGRDFDAMATRIEGLVTAQRQLLRDISHELRSPLARLQVALALARQRAGGLAGAEHDRVELEADRLDVLIGQILMLDRLDRRDGPEPESEPIDLSALVAQVADDAGFEAGGRGCRIEVVRNDPVTVSGNPDLLASAIENVVRNAVRYTAPGTAVEIALELAAGTGREAVLRVRDHGPGVPRDALEHLFEPFFRVDAARDRDSGGHGLGLAIAERAVRRHGGGVSAANAPDGGLVVSIRLPALAGEAHAAV